MNGHMTGWWLTNNGRHSNGPVTMMTIAILRKWAEAALGAPSSLVIEREDGKNRVALRFALPDGIAECDVVTLKALHRRRLSTPTLLVELREVLRVLV